MSEWRDGFTAWFLTDISSGSFAEVLSPLLLPPKLGAFHVIVYRGMSLKGESTFKWI